MKSEKLTLGHFGDEVARLHERLKTLGFDISTGEVKRKFFGPATREAIQQYQRKNGFAPSGELDEDTAGLIGTVFLQPGTLKMQYAAPTATVNNLPNHTINRRLTMSSNEAPVPSQPLTNSQRRLYKASYRPLIVPQSKQQETGHFLEKLALLRGLDIQQQEFEQLERDQAARVQSDPSGRKVPLIEIIRRLATDLSLGTMQQYGRLLASVSAEELTEFGNALQEIRVGLASDARQKLQTIQHRFEDAMPTASSASAQHAPLTGQMSAEAGLEWARAKGLPIYNELRDIAASLRAPLGGTLAPTNAGTTLTVISVAEISSIPERLDQRANLAVNLVNVFEDKMSSDPIGRVGELHLERLEMTPAGIEHGELVHSVPLTPKETVNISHREWSVTTTTFENIVQDSFEGFSETGVAEKTDLSHATDNEAKHSSALDVNGSVSASYNGGAYSVTASAAVDYRQQTDTQQIEKDSVAHSLAITRNASTRTKKDHKISFRVSSVAGAEDLAVRVLTNPSDTNAMRVDYFQLLRKWRVDLIRYGLRMTYDLVIPNPGLDLIGRTLEIQAIDEMLTTANYSFGLNAIDVTRDSWPALLQQYAVELDPPPEASISFTFHKEFNVGKDESHSYIFDSFDFEVPPDYEINDV